MFYTPIYVGSSKILIPKNINNEERKGLLEIKEN
jgi:hypothetical protein